MNILNSLTNSNFDIRDGTLYPFSTITNFDGVLKSSDYFTRMYFNSAISQITFIPPEYKKTTILLSKDILIDGKVDIKYGQLNFSLYFNTSELSPLKLGDLLKYVDKSIIVNDTRVDLVFWLVSPFLYYNIPEEINQAVFAEYILGYLEENRVDTLVYEKYIEYGIDENLKQHLKEKLK